MPRPVIMVSGKDPLLEPGSGHATYVLAHALAAQRAGYRVHVLAVGPAAGVEETPAGFIHRVRSPWPYGRTRSGIGHRAWLLRAHAPGLRRAGIDIANRYDGPAIVHSFGPYGGTGIDIAERARIQGLPIVSSYTTLAHEIAGKRAGLSGVGGRLTRWGVLAEIEFARLANASVERRGVERAARVLVNYESVRRLLAEEFGRTDGVVRIPYAPYTAFADRPPPDCGAREGPPRIVALARHDPRKRIDTLLDALALLHRRGVGFQARLVGGGQLLDTHRRRAAALGLAEVVELPGFVPDAAAELRDADIFAHHALEEGSGSMALLEALQAGLPGVVAAIDGLVEDVADGHEAFLVPPGDPAAFAAALERLVVDTPLRHAMARRARATFEQRFAAAPFAAALAAVYRAAGTET